MYTEWELVRVVSFIFEYGILAAKICLCVAGVLTLILAVDWAVCEWRRSK